jgi:hypothetical protein
MRLRGLSSPDRVGATIDVAAPLASLDSGGQFTLRALAVSAIGGYFDQRSLFDCEPVTFD